MSTSRFFISLDDNGQPLAQRNTVKAKPYLSASYDGSSFSSSPANGAYPRKVVEVAAPIEWVSRATLEDGSKVTDRSKKSPTAPNFVRFIYTTNPWDVMRNGQPTGVEPKRAQSDAWTYAATAADWLKRNTGHRDPEIVTFATGTVEIRNWPTAGDSVVLSDEGHNVGPLQQFKARPDGYGHDSRFANRTNPHGYPCGSPQLTGEADNPDLDHVDPNGPHGRTE